MDTKRVLQARLEYGFDVVDDHGSRRVVSRVESGAQNRPPHNVPLLFGICKS
jgi:hypothetical protein